MTGSTVVVVEQPKTGETFQFETDRHLSYGWRTKYDDERHVEGGRFSASRAMMWGIPARSIPAGPRVATP
jgi:hypothetical protein